jgi:hypothetical protein
VDAVGKSSRGSPLILGSFAAGVVEATYAEGSGGVSDRNVSGPRSTMVLDSISPELKEAQEWGLLAHDDR